MELLYNTKDIQVRQSSGDFYYSHIYNGDYEGLDHILVSKHFAFPDMSGFSPRNIRYMRTFALAYPDEQIVQRSAAQLPWRQTMVVLDKLKDQEQ
jgi:hypothetical protein